MYYHFLKVIFNRYFNGKSITDGGTLWHLQCLIKRHNISKDVSNEMNELEDFFHSVAKAHMTAAAMHYFDMQEKPTKHAWPHLLSMTQSTAPHRQYLSTTIGKFVDEYVMPSVPFNLSSTKTTQDSDASRMAFTTMPVHLWQICYL